MVKGKEKEIDILQFIDKFKEYEKNNVLVKTFTEGFCYYFALILKERFPQGRIMYHSVINHFVFELNNKLYDITGNYTEKANNQQLFPWEEYQKIEPLESQRIIRDCIKKNDVIFY